MTSLTRETVRRIDAAAMRELGIPGLLLMENAARGICDRLLQRKPSGAIVILCGPGNNGGDGLAVARQLAAAGVTVEVLLLRLGRTLSGDAATNLGFLRQAGETVREDSLARITTRLVQLTRNDWIVDALMGTGFRGPAAGELAAVIAAINGSPAQVLAADVPSGFDSDYGAVNGPCVSADETVTFVARKAGFDVPGADAVLGNVTVAPIGVPQAWLQNWMNRHAGDARE